MEENRNTIVGVGDCTRVNSAERVAGDYARLPARRVSAMSLDPQLRRSIRRLKELETLGEQLRQTATEPDPDAFGPTTVDREKFAAWRAQVIAFLDESGQRAEQFLGAFKKLRDAPLLDSVTEGLSILQGCRNHLSSAPPSGTTTPQNELMGTTPNIADRAIKPSSFSPAPCSRDSPLRLATWKR